MDRSCPSTASVLQEEARVLPGHYIWFDFYLDLFIHQFFWLWHGALLHTSPFFFFFPYIASVRDLPQKARMTVYMETKYN